MPGTLINFYLSIQALVSVASAPSITGTIWVAPSTATVPVFTATPLTVTLNPPPGTALFASGNTSSTINYPVTVGSYIALVINPGSLATGIPSSITIAGGVEITPYTAPPPMMLLPSTEMSPTEREAKQKSGKDPKSGWKF